MEDNEFDQDEYKRKKTEMIKLKIEKLNIP